MLVLVVYEGNLHAIGKGLCTNVLWAKEEDMHMQTCCPMRLVMHPDLELENEETMIKILELDDSLLRKRDLLLDCPINGTASGL